jgi:hypothetical protein
MRRTRRIRGKSSAAKKLNTCASVIGSMSPERGVQRGDQMLRPERIPDHARVPSESTALCGSSPDVLVTAQPGGSRSVL